MSSVLVATLLSVPLTSAHAAETSPPAQTPMDAALAKAEETGSPVEVAGRTSETRKLTALPDGQFSLETAPVPVRVERDGVFHDADLTLERTAEGRYASRMSVNGVTFGAGGDDVLATMTKDGKSLTLTWPGTRLPAPVLDGPSATFVDGGGAGVDLVVRSTPTGWSHYVVVKAPEAASDPALAKIEFGVQVSGLQLKELPGSRLAAVDEAGNEFFTAPEPLMWEGRTAPAEASPASANPEEIAAGPDPEAAAAPMTVETGGGVLTLTPDPELLTAPDTKFPIVLDPSWQTWNGSREGDGDGGSAGSGWAYVDQVFPNASYWKPDRLPTGREVEDYTNKRSYIRMDTSPLHEWSGSVQVKVNSAAVTFDVLHAWSCTARDVRLFNVGHIYSSTTYNTRPDAFIPEGSGWDSNWLATASVNVGRPECGDDGTSNNVTFTHANLTRLIQWATDHRWDIFTLGLFPDQDYNDTHTWKVMDVDPRMVVKFSRYPMPTKDVHMRNGGTTKYGCLRGSGRPWVGVSKDRTANALITDYDGDNAGGFDGQPLAAEYELAPLGKPEESWKRYVPPGGAFQHAGSDGYLHASLTIVKGDDFPATADGGTTWMWRVRGMDDTNLYGPWSAWCEYTVDARRPDTPEVSSPEYPAGATSGYDTAARKYVPGNFTFAPAGSGDVVKFDYRFADGTAGTKAVAAGASSTISWTPKRFGPQWVEVTSYDRAGNPSAAKKYEFGVEQPPRDAAWSMDEPSGTVAHAVGPGGAVNPNADLVFSGGPAFGEAGNLGAGSPTDRAVRLNGSTQFGEVKPWTDPEGNPVTLVDTSQRFMFSTWLRLASVQGDQVAISQAAADGTVFELGWLSGRWTFRHRAADGTVLTAVTRDMAQAGDGQPWSAHWVSLMGGYDPVNQELWLRTQAEGQSEVCDPDEPWNCSTTRVMAPEVKTASTTWTPVAGSGALLVGATPTGSSKSAFWNGWVDDSQLWPLAHPDDTVLNAIYTESVQDHEFAGKTLRLVNVNSGHCLDVAGAGVENGTNVQQWNCNTHPAQDWQFTDVGDGYYTLTSPNSGKCLDVDGTDGSGTADGRNVWQYECNGSTGQQWKPEKKAGGYWLKSRRSDKCLAVDAGSPAPGANVSQWSCTDPIADEQLWNITALKRHHLDGITHRLLVNSNQTDQQKCLDVAGGSTADGAIVLPWECNGGPWQKWRFSDYGDGYYMLTNVNTMNGDPSAVRCLEVADAQTQADAAVQQGTCEPGAEHQLWKVAGIADDGNLGYRLIAKHSGLVADARDQGAPEDARVVQANPVEPIPARQIWKLEYQ
ncbi:RICIN domain-containing protein [Actinomadura sp. B10D3]|uniref:RICIN domain-containing protein n=1 Tax=Actinomadura sp. B10D3 TaxID=3153557 RepID=UPI00325E18B1